MQFLSTSPDRTRKSDMSGFPTYQISSGVCCYRATWADKSTRECCDYALTHCSVYSLPNGAVKRFDVWMTFDFIGKEGDDAATALWIRQDTAFNVARKPRREANLLAVKPLAIPHYLAHRRIDRIRQRRLLFLWCQQRSNPICSRDADECDGFSTHHLAILCVKTEQHLTIGHRRWMEVPGADS